MSISSIVIFTTICWCLWCAFNFAVVSTNFEKGLFPNGPIQDFKDGSMASLFSWVNKHSVTLVFFYAPWSGQCIKLVPEIFSAYKRINSSIVTIAAINCWVGHCKERFPTYHFPRLFLYHSSYSPIEYLDDVEANAIVNFLQLSITPWKYIVTSKQLQTFVQNYDNYFVTYMDPQKVENDKVYDVFYYSTLLLINRSNRPQVAIVTNKTIAAMLQLTEHGQIRSQSLLSLNSYSTKLNYTAYEINRWMRKQTRRVVHILKPDPDKNFYVKQLKQGPAIILHSTLSAVENGLIQQYLNVAISYHHGCTKTFSHIKKNKKNICTTFLSGRNVCTICQFCTGPYICVDLTLIHFQEMRNLTEHASKCSSSLSTNSYFPDKYSICCLDITGKRKLSNVKSKLTVKLSILYKINRRIRESRMLKQMSILLGYMQQCFVDKNIQNVSDATQNGKKKRLALSLRLHKFVELDKEAKFKCTNTSVPCLSDDYLLGNMYSLIEGLSCNTNRTLNFFLLNYDRYKYLLKRIGIPDEPTLLIVELMKDEHYILTKQLTLRTMISFILRFTLGRLQQYYLPRNPVNALHQKSSHKIVELTSSSFEEVVMGTMKHVFVMFYALWCGMCKVVNLHFLKLVHLYDKEVIFSRIDADIHMLPWQFKASVYPSFIFFPANRKADSVNFPHHLPVTLQNLKNFLDTYI